MRFRILALSSLCIWLCPLMLVGQEGVMKWGEVPTWQLQQIDAYPADTNATAIVLADYGEITVENDWSVLYEHHRRVKLLSEAAYEDWGTFNIPYFAEDRTSKPRKVEGQTFTMDANGDVVRKKLDKKSIFTEKITDGLEQVRFTLPGLEPGAVIEFRYTIKYDNFILLPTWYFQADEPTLWSELRIEHPQDLAYAFASQGALDFHIREQEHLTRGALDRMRYRWVMKDVDALREEPYMTTVEDYRASMESQLAEYLQHGIGVNKVLQSWDELASDLMEDPMFGGQLGRHKAVRQQTEALMEGLTDPVEKVKAIHAFVRESIEWNGVDHYYPDKELHQVLKTSVGTGAELNLLLVDMLRIAGFTAHPVLISTRDNGQVLEVYPLVSQFNKLLVYAEVNGQSMVLDGTQRYGPYTLIPPRALSHRGWLVRDPNPEWIDLKAKGALKHQGAIIATLDENGTLAGSLQVSETEYSALAQRLYLKEHSGEELVKSNYLAGIDELDLESIAVENVDAVDEVLRASARFSMPHYGQAVGDYIYVYPFILSTRWDENPLRSPTRTFSVDINFPQDYVYTLRLTLPEGYEVQDMARPRRVGMPTGGGHFTRSMEMQGDVLVLQSRFSLNQSVYSPEQYPALRRLFTEVVALQDEPIVLKRQGDGTTDGDK